MVTRSDKFTVHTKKKEYYSDFLNNFDKNPLTGFLGKVTNEEAVKQSLRNLILTVTGERFYDNSIGSRVNDLLFEIDDELSRDDLVHTIRESCRRESRANIHNVFVNSSPLNNNALFVTVVFSLINIPNEQHSLELIVKRIR